MQVTKARDIKTVPNIFSYEQMFRLLQSPLSTRFADIFKRFSTSQLIFVEITSLRIHLLCVHVDIKLLAFSSIPVLVTLKKDAPLPPFLRPNNAGNILLQLAALCSTQEKRRLLSVTRTFLARGSGNTKRV